MVCFTANHFVFSHDIRHNYAKLLCKYYLNVPLVGGHELNPEFFENLEEEKEYKLVTERYWDGLATPLCLPKFEAIPRNSKSWWCPKLFQHPAITSIQNILAKRLSLKGAEMFLQSYYHIEDGKLLDVLAECELEKFDVTRFYYFAKQEQAGHRGY